MTINKEQAVSDAMIEAGAYARLYVEHGQKYADETRAENGYPWAQAKRRANVVIEAAMNATPSSNTEEIEP